MRPLRLLAVPLALIASLAAASPAMALDIGVADFDFTPAGPKIAVGETVTWNFEDSGHTATALRGQADYWDSDLKSQGATFARTFTKPGRFSYICRPHSSFMKGSITVGTDAVSDTVDAFKTKRSGTKVTVSFKLNEAARVTYKLRGPSRKTVKQGRLKAGRHSFTVKRLEAGAYGGTLVAEDDFRKKSSVKKSFAVG